MRLWIIYTKAVLNPKKSNAISWMLDEAKTLGFETEIIFAEDLVLSLDNNLQIYYQGRLINKPDAAFLRCYDTHMIEQLEMMHIKTFNNAQALSNCLNKWKTHQLLVKANIPTPKTIYSHYEIDFEFLKSELDLPFVLKDIYGKQGEQVYLIHDKKEYLIKLNYCEYPMFQKYIHASYGRDIRVHVIGGKVITSVLRVSKDDFKSNFSQGGQALEYELDTNASELALRSATALNLDFAGIDILFTEDGYSVCEVNGVPGFRTVGLTSKVNIPKIMLTHIKEQLS